jgi:hypothetical protein
MSPCRLQEGMWYSSYSFLASALDEVEWSTSRPGRDIPREKTLGTHCTGGLVGWTQRLGEKSSAYADNRTPVVQCVVRHYTD